MADPWHIGTLDMTLRLALSLILGGIIGFEREMNRHAAGLRTNILVCMGSTLIMLLSMYGFSQFVDETSVRLDPARLAAQVISGIGFLGAGTIMQKGMFVKGLTTAATLWVMAAIGLAVGAGFIYPAILTCGMVFISLRILNKIEHRYFTPTTSRAITITLKAGSAHSNKVYEVLTLNEARISELSIQEKDMEGAPLQEISLQYTASKTMSWIAFAQSLKEIPDVTSIEFGG
ncbi:MgtC/SapB family protein [Gorillibacterium sp. sgz500922]|uniref:MgtC/SapB family protein n=1 Tax=Gorillibacterium sp. sgz500922 TaxID=3446694 RepID=UPI003F67BE40